MNQIEPGKKTHEAPNHESVHQKQRPHWTRAHRDWRVWVGVILMLLAMAVYFMTDGFLWRPGVQPQQPLPGAVKR
jgi:hypothetical protein